MPVKTKKKAQKQGQNGQKAGQKAQRKAQKIAQEMANRPQKFNKFQVREWRGEKAMTADDAKELLGWEEVEDKGEFHFLDMQGKKIYCRYNCRNRPFSREWALSLGQDVLNRHWRFNGEHVILGTSGDVLSGQHRLVGLVFAEQIRTGRQAEHWEKLWAGPVSIECTVAEGVPEDLETLRTLDNVRPRKLSDILHGSPEFLGYDQKQRGVITKILERAIKFLWKRTGMHKNMFHGHQTHSESLSFMGRHPHLLKAVQHVFEEDGTGKDGGRIGGPGRWVGLGVAAGLCYLMGCSSSDGSAYRNPKADKETGLSERSERGLNWDNWEKAKEFWTILAGADFKEDRFVKPLRTVQKPVDSPDSEDGKALANVWTDSASTEADKVAHLCNAWKVFLGGEKNPTKGDFKLEYRAKSNGGFVLAEDVTAGGIDQGSESGDMEVSDEEEEIGTEEVKADVSQEDVEAEAQKIKAENDAAAGAYRSPNLD